MPLATQPELREAPVVMPAQPIVEHIRRLAVVAALAAVGYGIFTTASAGYCPGGVNADGAFTDVAGNVTALAPSCITLTLTPSIFVYMGIFAIVIRALTLVIRRAGDLSAARRFLDRGAAGVVILAVASVAISQIWFSMIPITEWDGSGTFYFPFPFGAVDLVITPMGTP